MVLTCEQVRRERANSSNGSWRSLYDCFHARVKGKSIYCEKGHRFCENSSGNGAISIDRLARGNPLILSICQGCPDFDCMGPPVPPEEKGWLKKKGVR